MITDNDREDLIEDIRAYNDGWMLEEGKDRDRLIEFENVIRAESAEQTRKEAAERVAYAWREHGEDITLRIIHDAILSTVNESFTVAPVSTDAEKLSIAVNALERIRDKNDKLLKVSKHHFCDYKDCAMSNYQISINALKEIQG